LAGIEIIAGYGFRHTQGSAASSLVIVLVQQAMILGLAN
jgi:hypothetical protein